MKVEDLRPKGAGWQLRLHEKGGKHHEMPCHHALAEELRAYIDAAGIAEDRKGYLFRTAPGHNATVLLEKPMAQSDAWRMIRRRAVAVGIQAPIGNHSFRATGITAYLANGGALEPGFAVVRQTAGVSGTSQWFTMDRVRGVCLSRGRRRRRLLDGEDLLRH